MRPEGRRNHLSLVQTTFRDYISLVQTSVERIPRQPVQGGKAFFLALLRKFQNITEVNAALIADSMVCHDARLKQFDEEWA
jgi:hypothetical protein